MALVDSSVWIDALRRRGRLDATLAVQGLLDAYEAQWCSPVRLEVMGGARPEERGRLGHQFSTIPYHICTEQDLDRALALAWKLRDHGLSIPRLDVVVAAIALHAGSRLSMHDEPFVRIAEIVPLRLYGPGYGGLHAKDEG